MPEEMPEGFEFREFEAGPRRDIARHFHQLASDTTWLPGGEKRDHLLTQLREARETALDIAQGMIR